LVSPVRAATPDGQILSGGSPRHVLTAGAGLFQENAMKFRIEDKAGWQLAEGRIEKNRAEARALVERLERDIKIERLVKASRRAALAPVGDLHRRAGADGGPMAIRMNLFQRGIAALLRGFAS
jgi:hypothetical protein